MWVEHGRQWVTWNKPCKRSVLQKPVDVRFTWIKLSQASTVRASFSPSIPTSCTWIRPEFIPQIEWRWDVSTCLGEDFCSMVRFCGFNRRIKSLSILRQVLCRRCGCACTSHEIVGEYGNFDSIWRKHMIPWYHNVSPSIGSKRGWSRFEKSTAAKFQRNLLNPKLSRLRKSQAQWAKENAQRRHTRAPNLLNMICNHSDHCLLMFFLHFENTTWCCLALAWQGLAPEKWFTVIQWSEVAMLIWCLLQNRVQAARRSEASSRKQKVYIYFGAWES